MVPAALATVGVISSIVSLATGIPCWVAKAAISLTYADKKHGIDIITDAIIMKAPII